MFNSTKELGQNRRRQELIRDRECLCKCVFEKQLKKFRLKQTIVNKINFEVIYIWTNYYLQKQQF